MYFIPPKLVGKLRINSPSVIIELFADFYRRGTASRNTSLSSSYLQVKRHILQYIKSVFTDSSSFLLVQQQASYDCVFHQHVQTVLGTDKLQTLQAAICTGIMVAT